MYDIYFELLNMHQPIDDEDQLVFEFKKEIKKPCICSQCKEINVYAEPNQVDGSFKCFSCRNY